MQYLTQKGKTEIKTTTAKEKLLRLGAEALSKKELLSVLTGSGVQDSSLDALSKLINKYFKNHVFNIPTADILNIKGIGEAKALRIVAALSFLEKYYKKHLAAPATETLDHVDEEAQEYLVGVLPKTSNCQPRNGSCNKKLLRMMNEIHEGDCLDVMRHIPSESIDMILCDLPYGTTQNKWDSVIPLNRLWCEYDRILKKNGVVVLTSQGVFTAKLILSNEALFKYKIVWEKSKPTNFLNSRKQPLRKHEDVCIFYKEQPVYNPQMTEGVAYNKGVRKNQLTGCYGDFKPVEVKSLGELDTDLAHALVNSILGLFFIEALGFGRGLGALDLSTARLREGLKMLNPNLLNHDQQKQIKEAFRPISRRSVLPLQDELGNADRLIFDEAVLSCFGISKYRENIEQSLRWLHRRRCLPRD